VKNLLSPAVNRRDLQRINYNKTIFGKAKPQTLLGKLMVLCKNPQSDEEGVLLPHSPPLGRLILLLNWYTHYLDQSYTTACWAKETENSTAL